MIREKGLHEGKKEERQSCTDGLRIKNPVLKGADHRSAPAGVQIRTSKGGFVIAPPD